VVDPSPPLAAVPCPHCGTVVAPALLNCPSCHRLTHADLLKSLASQAQLPGQNPAKALELWRDALALLPLDSRQHQAVSESIARLSKEVESKRFAGGGASAPGKKGKGALFVVAAVLLGVAFKLKFVFVFILTHLKFLALGLTKSGVLVSMALSLGVYWTAWGWKFALGLIASIYVHEMGHVMKLKAYGIKATAPMFIPGVGAYVRLKQSVANATEDARVGLAGPVWGAGAALAFYAAHALWHWPMAAAIAKIGAWINLFNLLPLWQLDGGRAFRAFSRNQKWLLAVVMAFVWGVTREGLLILLLLAAIFRAVQDAPPEEPDNASCLTFLLLLVFLSSFTFITLLQLPTP
jgi:Zn-dependent protease